MTQPYREVRILKQGQLETEIRESSAAPREKENMLHSLSKLGMFAAEEAEEAKATGRAQFAPLLREAKEIAALKYEITHKGSGPPSNYDPDIYQLEKVTAPGWWRFVHAVRDLLGAKERPAPQPEKGSPTCLDCGHPLTEADRQAPACPYCGCP